MFDRFQGKANVGSENQLNIQSMLQLFFRIEAGVIVMGWLFRRLQVYSLPLFFFMFFASPVVLAAGAQTCTNHPLDWSQYPDLNGIDNTTYPFIETAVNIGGSGVDLTVTMPREGRDKKHVANSSTTFPIVATYMNGNPQVYRYWGQADITPADALTYNFSENISVNKFMFGGHRPPSGKFAYGIVTFWDGPNGTGNKVTSLHANGAGSAATLANLGDPTTEAINVLPYTSSGDPANYPSSFLSTENDYAMVTYDKDFITGQRTFTVLDMGGATVRSMTWIMYTSTVDVSPKGDDSKNLATPESSISTDVNMSGYIGNFEFDVCESASVPSCDTNNGHFGGTVFRDTNSDGAQGLAESGFGVTGMQVIAYDTSNTTVETAVVADDGRYVLTGLTNSTDYRLEFIGLPVYLQSTAEGVNSDASVRFVNTASCALDFGVHNPAQYCQTSPRVATTCFVNGDPNEAGIPTDTIVAFGYDGTGKAAIGHKDKTGSTWGVAYDSKRDQLYTAAILRRHVGMGPAGAGGIYAIANPAGAVPGDPTMFYTLAGVGAVPDNIARGLDGIAPTALNHDAPAFPLVGKVGLGDLEISNDGNTLYVVNLADKLIYSINLEDTAAAPGNLPAFPVTACNNGEARPWALKVRDDQLYLGVVCSAEQAAGTADDLTAYVYAYDGSSWSTVIDAFALNYPREKVVNSPASAGEWTPWRDTVDDFNPPNLSAFGKPTPILSDIEFDDQGNMILGFLDRTGIQFGALNWGTGTNETIRYQIASGGDILKATSNGDGSYTVETITSATDEFYNQDFFPGKHFETAQGGLAVLPGSGQVMTVGMDPLIVNTGGIYWFDTVDGSKKDALQLYDGRAAEGLSGKAVGLGDLELMCEPAALEVGNRLWCDSNSDGIQTPGEPNVGAGIDVTLTCETESTTIQTDANGKYLFTDANWAAAGTTTSARIPRVTACTIVVDYTLIATACSYSATSVTTQNVGSDTSNSAQSDVRDSDATDTGVQASISFTTGESGENNHSLDIGFKDGVSAATYDFGDAPDSYLTSDGVGGAKHQLSSDLYLGVCVDDEISGSTLGTADNDDVAAALTSTHGTCAVTNDDEDSLTPPTLSNGQAVPQVTIVTVNTTATDATLACWIDYNGNGRFDNASERAEVTVGTGAASAVITLPDVPASASADTGGSSYLRCRIASNAAEVADASGIANSGEVEDYPVSINAIPSVSLDWGDAPSANYPTLLANNGPSHNLDANLLMGACVDDEVDGQPDSTAEGDDNATASASTLGTCTTANDDEDSLTPPIFTDGQSAPTVTVSVVNSTGAEATLACWVDYDGDGTFDNTTERGLVTVADNDTSAVVTLPDVPGDANNVSGGSSFMRCRLASDAAEVADSTGAASNGEVEDYPVSINAVSVDLLDFGDAPDSYGTDLNNGGEGAGAQHSIINGLKLGIDLDNESDGIPSVNADGDDTEGFDDEDGVLISTLTDGQNLTLNTVVTNTTGGNATLVCWIDYNGDGVFATDGSESGSTTVPNASNNAAMAVPMPTVPVTASAVTNGSTYARCRLSTDTLSESTPTGSMNDGEVEDYRVAISAVPVYDFGDAPDSYGTDLNDDGGEGTGAQHTLINGLKLGANLDDEANGLPGTGADGDDTDGADDEDGVVIPTLTDGQALTLNATVTNTTGGDATLICWIDYNKDGVFAMDGSESGTATVANGSTDTAIAVTLPDVPATASSDTGGSTYARCRLSTDALTDADANGLASNGEVEDYRVNISPVPVYDFGDAPDSYGTDLTDDGGEGAGAQHTLVNGLKLGANLDDEADGLPGTGADGDDTDGADDEDGVVIPTLTDGQALTLNATVTNTTGGDATLICWIDYNKDGVFATDGSESGTATVANGSTDAAIAVTLPDVPATASSDTGGNTYARCRLSTDGLTQVNPTGFANDGEVEDYPVNISAVPVYDFGDAPDSYGTDLTDDGGEGTGAQHTLINGLKLGANLDDEANGLPGTGADGDDVDGADDEDGVVIPTLTDGQALTLNATVTNTTGGDATLICWIDYNKDGVFATDGSESGTATVANGSTDTAIAVTLPDVLATASSDTGGSTYARCRLSTDALTDADSNGLASNGEVEDYRVNISPVPVYDFGDAPDSYGTDLTDDGGEGTGAQHTLINGLKLGTNLDDEADGLPGAGADGDDTDGADDEDGVVIPTLSDGQALILNATVTNTTGDTATLICWIDYNGDGKFATNGSESTRVTVADGSLNAAINVNMPDVPVTASTDTNGSSYARCRLSTDGLTEINPTGFANDGEVEDYRVVIEAAPALVFKDWGDAPDSIYPTSSANNGPNHTLDNRLYLGACVDDEADGQSSFNALGDDTTDAANTTEGNCLLPGHDEDGLILPVFTDGQSSPQFTVSTVNTTGADATLACWLDYNGDGQFDNATERGTATVANGATSVIMILPDVPENAASISGGSSYMRCRLASDPGQVQTPAGSADSGEIEDYTVEISAEPVYDFGDAPDSYGTNPGSNGAGHRVVPGLQLGAALDQEIRGEGGQTAEGDGADEDGVIIPDLVDNGAVSLQVTVSNVTGKDANLVCWIDYNGDGVFATDGSESGSRVVPSSGNNLSVSVSMPPVPATASQDTGGVTYARCRLTTDPITEKDSTGLANDGEVEDYRISVRAPADISPPSIAQPIPTLSEWMLIMLSSLMVLLAWRSRRQLDAFK